MTWQPRAGGALAALAWITVLATACSSGQASRSVASLPGADTAATAGHPQAQQFQKLVDFARCMRGHGVTLPDPLMQGVTPAWRPFAPGMAGGPDVTELQRNLIRLGYAEGLFGAPSGQFDWLTTDAVIRWQLAAGYPPTGQISLGQVVFLPGPVVTGAQNAAPGQAATPGQSPYQVTATTRVITVPVTQNLPPVSAGEPVSVILPSGATTPGRVTAIGPPPPGPAGGTSGSGNVATVLTISPGHPAVTGSGQDIAVQVSLTSQSARDVLAVPVSALLALAGGGYGVEIVEPSGGRRLTGVTTGLFASTLVQVSGPGIRPGVKVVTAQ